MISHNSNPTDLSHWNFARWFSGKDAAALILGIDPTSATAADIARTAPVLDRLRYAYGWAKSAALEIGAETAQGQMTSDDFPPGTLPSIDLFQQDFQPGAGATDWVLKALSDFDYQFFTRGTLQGWLNAERLPTAYRFYPPPPASPVAQLPATESNQEVGLRERTTYLNIVGALLDLMLEPGPTGGPRSGFKDEAAIKQGILARFPKVRGLSQRSLDSKFPAARKSLAE